MKEQVNKKGIITVIVVGVVLVIGLIIGLMQPPKQKTWYEEIGETRIYSVVKTFLKERVNYPETFEFTDYPNFTYGTEEERLVRVDGGFKSANAFGVYSRHSFTITIHITDKWVVKYYNIS